ncbi:MAG: YbaK/EbsC family protein, partial [Chloroflexi bacterium]|nr:YbaK/EbsC family protein [Chloroflexota bacterium]
AYTAQEVAAAQHVPGKQVAKVVMVKAGKQLMMAVLPAPYRVDLKKLASALGAKSARLAREEEFEGIFPDCEVGAMPPFGNLYQLPVYVDASLTEDVEIVFQTGTHSDTMKIRYADYQRLAQPKVAEYARRP